MQAPRSVLGKAVRDQAAMAAWWTFTAVAMTGWVTAVYPSLRRSAALVEFIDNMPVALMAILGVDPDIFLTGAGFLAAQLYTLVCPLVMIGFAIALGSAVTARDEQAGTMDVLLALPVTRRSLLLSRAAALALLTGLLASALLAALLVCNAAFDLRVSIGGLLSANLSLWLLGLVFGALTMALGAFTGNSAVAIGAASVLAFCGWLAHGFARLYSWLEVPARMSPFAWYADHQPLLGHWSSGLLYSALCAVAFTALAVRLFERRDIGTERSVLPKLARRLQRSANIAPRSAGLLRNAFTKDLWERRRSLWIWVAVMVALIAISFGAWPSVSRSAETLQSMIAAVPRELLAMFGLTDPAALATPAGFISSRAYLTVGPVVIVVYCVAGVGKLIAREESSGLLDAVVASAQARRALLVQKLAALVVSTLVVVAALTLAVLAGNAYWHTGIAAQHIVAANLGLALLGLFFAGVAVALWALLPARGSPFRWTASIAGASYLANGLGALVESLAPLRAASPFYWYLGDTVPLARGFGWSYVLLLVGAVAGAALAVRSFGRRDLRG